MLPLYTASQIKDLDRCTCIENDLTEQQLVSIAARAFVDLFWEKIQPTRKVYIFCGNGLNGADGMAIAKLLSDSAYQVQVFLFDAMDYRSWQSSIQVDLQNNESLFYIKNELDFPAIEPESVIIDALLGIGLNRKVDGLYLSVIQKINQSKAYTVSVDIPSGMRAEDSMEGVVIKADWTITFEQPKISMLMTDNVDFVGALSVAPIGISSACKTQQKTNKYYLEATSVYRLLQPKARSVHKYQRGVGLLIAGSINMPGALQLSATAAMRSGMGMLYIHTNKEVFDTLSNQLPEALYVNELNTNTFQPILKKINAIAIGPGMELGDHSLQLLEQVLQLKNQNIVLDATALGLLNKVSNWEEKIKVSSCILTPHQGEFDQLFGKQKNDSERLQTAIAKAQTLNCVIVLKGPHTAICMPNGNCYFNSTGNQGMAKAGSGDVLTGIILSLLAQKYNREEAAIIGVYMHGWAGDSAAEKVGMESMIASDIILSIPLFYKNQNLYN